MILNGKVKSLTLSGRNTAFPPGSMLGDVVIGETSFKSLYVLDEFDLMVYDEIEAEIKTIRDKNIMVSLKRGDAAVANPKDALKSFKEYIRFNSHESLMFLYLPAVFIMLAVYFFIADSAVFYAVSLFLLFFTRQLLRIFPLDFTLGLLVPSFFYLFFKYRRYRD